MNEPNLPFDSNRETGLEQRLNNLKPRQPFVDINAIAKIADAKVTLNQVVVATSPQSKGWFSPTALAGSVAASWICGVAVGAAFVFLSLPRNKSSDRELNVAEKSPIEKVHETTVPMHEKPTPSRATMAEAAVAAAKSEFDTWELDLGTEPLQVGMSLRPRNRLVRTGRLSTASAQVRSSKRGSSDADESQKVVEGILEAVSRNPLPFTPVTQSELLKTLMHDANQNIY